MTKIVQLPIFTKHQTPHIKKERELKNRFIYKKGKVGLQFHIYLAQKTRINQKKKQKTGTGYKSALD
jgi:hypothetical protein